MTRLFTVLWQRSCTAAVTVERALEDEDARSSHSTSELASTEKPLEGDRDAEMLEYKVGSDEPLMATKWGEKCCPSLRVSSEGSSRRRRGVYINDNGASACLTEALEHPNPI